MPELAEVRLSKEAILPKLQNQQITDIKLYSSGRYRNTNPDNYEQFKQSLQNDKVLIENIKTKGKFMYWKFSNDWWAFVHFGMSGQFFFTSQKHNAYSFDYGNNETIYFNDIRHFGSLKFTNNKQELLDKLNSLGWDPFRNKIEDYFSFLKNKVCNSNKTISELLMDQSLFSGTGNYIKSEALYEAQISPWRLGKNISEEELKIICRAIENVVNSAYAHQGSTFHSHKNPDGTSGKHSSFFKVYKKEIDPLGNKIISETTPDKRTSHWSPNIQK